MIVSLLALSVASGARAPLGSPPAPPPRGRIFPMHNGGTPGGIPPKTDCNVREFMWDAGQKLMPRRGSFKTLFDAMQVLACLQPHSLLLHGGFSYK